MTLRQAVAEAAARLAADAYLSADARRDAEVLLIQALGITRAQLLASSGRRLTGAEHAVFAENIARRLTHEPVQYITGQQEFYGLAFRVTPAVLIPRPETEHLVEAVLAHLQSSANQPLRIADVGTGSGAIAIALATHLPTAEIIATDTSPEALEVARSNARTHQVAERIRFVEADLLDIPLAESSSSPSGQFFNVIASNPPYVALTEAAELHPQVRDHEPHGALFAGESGLDIYRRLIPQAQAALKPGGLLALEIGHNQHAALSELLNCWCSVRFVQDLQDIARIALAQKPA